MKTQFKLTKNGQNKTINIIISNEIQTIKNTNFSNHV